MPAPIVPWMPSNIPSEIQSELNRRKVNRSFKYVANSKASWDSSTGDWNKYKGPMTSWVRVCSNGAGHPAIQKERFVLNGGKGFYQTYGFTPTGVKGAREQIIGYTPGENGSTPIPHVIENNLNTPSNEPVNYPIHVGTPEISRIEVTVQKELLRRVSIEWVCFSWKQLVYMTPYFLVPGISVMVEWGWNHFNPVSLVKLDDKNLMRDLFTDKAYSLYTDNILKSNGNYDVVYGIITNFNWTVEGNKIVCNTEITSKDRLYAGIAKDSALTVKSGEQDDQPNGLLQSIRDFIVNDETIKNLKSIAMSRNPRLEVLNLSNKTDSQNVVWSDIIHRLMDQGTETQQSMRTSYVHGVFAGRSKDLYKPIGNPSKHDFDYTILDNDADKLWINMGMIVEILNYFSNRDGAKGQPMFNVDISESVISGHPNLMSCDAKVVVPNYGAPKYHYGGIGWLDYGYKKPGDASSEVGESTEGSEYRNQFVFAHEISKASPRPADQIISKVLYQFAVTNGAPRSCYRSDLDRIMNVWRYRNVRIPKPIVSSYSFPSTEDVTLPSGIKLEKDVSGLLSNIYVSYAAFKEIIEDTSVASYTDVYKKLLEVIMMSTDGFWDLALVEAEGKMTIVDRRYISKSNIMAQGDPTYSFDYYDADSLIKTLKFRPQLSDAQATRAIYGETNNKDSKYVYIDKNDLLDYKFKDAVILPTKDKEQGDPAGELEKMKTQKNQIRALLHTVQKINDDKDGTYQMTVISNTGIEGEIVKLVLPNQQLLRLLLDDKDETNNPRYCAIQPGITLELTLMGIGGLRTFQYFIIKNLPEPYSNRNIIFRIINVRQSVETGNWETTIQAGLLPLRNYIKQRLTPPIGGWPSDATPNPTN